MQQPTQSDSLLPPLVQFSNFGFPPHVGSFQGPGPDSVAPTLSVSVPSPNGTAAVDPAAASALMQLAGPASLPAAAPERMKIDALMSPLAADAPAAPDFGPVFQPDGPASSPRLPHFGSAFQPEGASSSPRLPRPPTASPWSAFDSWALPPEMAALPASEMTALAAIAALSGGAPQDFVPHRHSAGTAWAVDPHTRVLVPTRQTNPAAPTSRKPSRDSLLVIPKSAQDLPPSRKRRPTARALEADTGEDDLVDHPRKRRGPPANNFGKPRALPKTEPPAKSPKPHRKRPPEPVIEVSERRQSARCKSREAQAFEKYKEQRRPGGMFPPVPTIQLTEADLDDFPATIARLERLYSAQYGGVKLVVPEGVRNRLKTLKVDVDVPCSASDLRLETPTKQPGVHRILEERRFDVPLRQYYADLCAFGHSAIPPFMDRTTWISERFPYITDIQASTFDPADDWFPLNQNCTVGGLAGWSRLQQLQAAGRLPDVVGVTSSVLLAGRPKQCSSWHYEDGRLGSMNVVRLDEADIYGLLHAPPPDAPDQKVPAPPDEFVAEQAELRQSEIPCKQWWFANEKNSKKLFDVIGRLFPSRAAECQSWTQHKFCVPSPKMLVEEYDFELHSADQFKDDIILTFYNTSHLVYNSRFSIAEAVNWATESWAPVGRRVKPCNCRLAPMMPYFPPELFVGPLPPAEPTPTDAASAESASAKSEAAPVASEAKAAKSADAPAKSAGASEESADASAESAANGAASVVDPSEAASARDQKAPKPEGRPVKNEPTLEGLPDEEPSVVGQELNLAEETSKHLRALQQPSS
eukprot:TRINITY_DN7036_c0_g1_i1.p1 TRINITY_DN7036_c0_g1~~TRINITY_DN7036_c0_g1_i1.p1  ORF type:complete len:818 (+),score=255.01 TRINITY_DN7036_c0_g1_i1:26-2455(+)